MDQVQEPNQMLQHLDFLGTYDEAYKTIFSRGLLFAQITAVVILPFAAFLLTYHYFLFDAILQNPVLEGSFIRLFTIHAFKMEDTYDGVISTFSSLFVIQSIYLMLVLIFSTISTTAIAYTVVCFHVGKQVTFKQVMSIVPKVCHGVFATLLPYIVIASWCNVFAASMSIIFSLCNKTPELSAASTVALLMLVFIYMLGFAYFTIKWNFDGVVTLVLEGVYGMEAIQRSRNLVNRKLMATMKIFFIPLLGFIGIEIGFWMLVVFGSGDWGVGVRIVCALAVFLALSVLSLLGFVALIVLYFTHEKVKKAKLLENLEGHFAESEPFKGGDARSGQLSDLP